MRPPSAVIPAATLIVDRPVDLPAVERPVSGGARTQRERSPAERGRPGDAHFSAKGVLDVSRETEFTAQFEHPAAGGVVVGNRTEIRPFSIHCATALRVD